MENLYERILQGCCNGTGLAVWRKKTYHFVFAEAAEKYFEAFVQQMRNTPVGGTK